MRACADEMIFRNERGELTEGARSNIFVRRAEHLLTPPLSAGLLPGVLRAELLDSGRCEEAVLTEDDLKAGFFGNSLRGIDPRHAALGDSRRGRQCSATLSGTIQPATSTRPSPAASPAPPARPKPGWRSLRRQRRRTRNPAWCRTTAAQLRPRARGRRSGAADRHRAWADNACRTARDSRRQPRPPHAAAPKPKPRRDSSCHHLFQMIAQPQGQRHQIQGRDWRSHRWETPNCPRHRDWRTPCTLLSASTTPVLGSSLMRVVPR